MLLDGSVDGLSIVNAIADEPIDFLINLIQQLRYLRRILLVAFGHGRGDNLPLVIDTDMEFFPRLALLLPVFLGVPFALAAHL
jgi:hypothetical protein